ncbi:MAG: hypothetical protein IK123_08650 [Lachnospiraceae bacterium]|nr:hypothetical protein [Lachnospiraceae bacterium]
MLTMCDYYGMCDEHGKCVGHPVKVTKEYGKILKDLGEEIRLVCSPCIIDEVCGDETSGQLFAEAIRLPYDISIVGNGIGKRIADKFKLFKNIKIALKNKGTIFFYQVDFFFFLYLKLFYKNSADRKIVILIYHQDFTGGRLAGMLRAIYEKALGKVDTVIYTQKGAKVPHDNAVWMPDFIYRADEYEKYQTVPKEDRVVCLGTMSRYKQIEELVDVWRACRTAQTASEQGAEDATDMSAERQETAVGQGGAGESQRERQNGLPELIIAGRFDTKERFDALSNNLPSNVTIRDEVLSNEEYMTLLSGSKYSILPYDMEQYKNRTSGVLLESIYCGVIPIAPDKLLKQNMLPGLGYDSLAEVSDMLQKNDGAVADSFAMIYKEYGLEYAVNVLKNALIGEK